MYTSAQGDLSDEETPLLSGISTPVGKLCLKRKTPLPKMQLAILMVVQIAEPISATFMLPFINEMIGEFDVVGGDQAKTGYYVGLMVSIFFATEALTVLHWSQLSDKIGRKPVLLIGLAGLTISMALFGLSRSFWPLVLSRCMCGLLNGNTGVIKSSIGEITDSTNMGRAFSLFPIVWALGVTFAPFMGGTLQKPADRFPYLFDTPFWRTYPYALPCFICSLFCSISFLVAFGFFKETLPCSSDNLHSREITATSSSASSSVTLTELADIDVSPRQSPSIGDPHSLLLLIKNWNVVISVANYGILALLDIAYGALQPVFYASPLSLGGLQMEPPMIGLLLGSFGLVNGFFQAFVFPQIVSRCGLKNTFLAGMSVFLPIFAFFPVINSLAKGIGGLNPLLWTMLILQLSLGLILDMSYSSVFVYITTAAPNKHSLGATNGLAQLTASILRAIGPLASTSLFAFSVEHQCLGGYAVYAFLVALSIGALRVAILLPKEAWHGEEDG